MKTLLDAIKKYPQIWIDTLEMRSGTTPSFTNKTKHQMLLSAIFLCEWDIVESILADEHYRKPLEGVVACLNRYNDFDNETFHSIIELHKQHVSN